MINKIREMIRKPDYVDIRLINKAHYKGVRLVKIPIKKTFIIIGCLLIAVCLFTPCTNILIPLIIMKWLR